MDEQKTSRIEKLFGLSSNLIMFISIGIAIFWIISPSKFNLEPLLVLLGLLYAAVPIAGRWLLKKLNINLEKERLSLSYALAYGYFNNYLVPVVRRLRKDEEDPDKLQFYVYIPKSLEELHRDSINDILTELGNQSYEVDKIELDFPEEKRSKDFRTAKKLTDGQTSLKYFDFPTTLLTLEQAVAFKMTTKEGESPEKQKARLGAEHIADFKTHLTNMLNDSRFENIRRNIKVVDGGFKFLDEA